MNIFGRNKICRSHDPIWALVLAFLLTNIVSVRAQVITNAYDVASNYGSFAGKQGFGFGAWAVPTTGGGKYISGDAPPYFGIWNSTANSVSTSVRSFNSTLAVGQTFSVQLMMNNLDT